MVPSALQSAFLVRLSASLAEPLTLSNTPFGTRRIMYMLGGTFAGPRLTGALLPGGGDWVLVRPDGVATLDIRLVLRTDDDALIYVRCEGIFQATPDIRERILKGEEIAPSGYYFRTTPVFETGAERYRWLNHLVTVGVATRTTSGMVTDVFAIG